MSVASELAEAFDKAISGNHVEVNIRRVTRTTSNITGDEILTSGTAVTHKALFANRTTKELYDKEGQFLSADAFLIMNGSVVLSGGCDLVTYAGSVYEVKRGELRRYEGSGTYSYAELYLKETI